MLIKLVCISFFAICLVGTDCTGKAMVQQVDLETEFLQDQRQIDYMRSSRDYFGLMASVETIEGKWSTKDLHYFAELMLKTLDAIQNSNQADEIRFFDSQRIAAGILKNFENLPLETAVRFLPYLKDEPTDITRKGWELQRRVNVELWLGAWRRLALETDKDFDPTDVPQMNVAPPKETGLPSGVSPEAIQDRDLRQKYEQTIVQNRQKADRYNHQYRLRRLAEWFPRKAQAFLVSSYSKAPFDTGELRELLINYVVQETTRADIIKQVAARTVSR